MWLITTSDVAGNLPFCLDPGEYIVGRSKRCDIVVADATVSRQHARLTCRCKQVVVEDLKSSNGTFLNDRPIVRAALAVGDRIRFGGVTCAAALSPLATVDLPERESTFHAPREPDQTAIIEQLTAAQREIVDQMLQGREEGEIAHFLRRSQHTVHTHVKAIFQRLGVHSRAELLHKLLGRH